MKKSDYEYFKNVCHESDKEIKQIEEVLKVVKIEAYFKENGKTVIKKISKGKAREILGDKHYLDSIDRCAFHYTSAARNDSGEIEIGFDARKYFNDCLC